MLEVRAGVTDVARAAQVEHAHALGQGPLDPGSRRIAFLKGWCPLVGASGGQGLVLVARQDA